MDVRLLVILKLPVQAERLRAVSGPSLVRISEGGPMGDTVLDKSGGAWRRSRPPSVVRA